MKSSLKLCAMLVLASGTGLTSHYALAACGENPQAQCLTVIDGKVTQGQCKITECANQFNAYSGWELADGGSVEYRYQLSDESSSITVNGKPGVSIPADILKEPLICYAGTAPESELPVVYCSKDAGM
ncbi:hypothetical protein L9G15_06400 [Shewanella sp. A3A]|nr:hypothetical protein [Shewanella ferrihydritica]